MRHPEVSLGSLGELEMRPAWVPNLVERADSNLKRRVSHGLSQFEWDWFHAAKVRNVSRLGSQGAIANIPSILFC